MGEMKTSAQVAKLIGISRPALMMLLHRHEGLRPQTRLGGDPKKGDYLWTEEDVQRVQDHKCGHKRGRPKGK